MNRQVAAVEERNLRYEALVLSHKVADGGFISRPTQTIHNPQKNQNDMAAPSTLREFGVQVHQQKHLILFITITERLHSSCCVLFTVSEDRCGKSDEQQIIQ